MLLASVAMLSADPLATGKLVGKVTSYNQVIAETRADASGTFLLSDVPVGDHVVIAGDKPRKADPGNWAPPPVNGNRRHRAVKTDGVLLLWQRLPAERNILARES